MPDYEKLYHKMFAAADAAEAIERADTEAALELLIRAQREAEEICIAGQ